MSKRKKPITDKKSQPYDTSLKTWVKEDPANIIPVLLPGSVFLEVIDIEAIKPTMRCDSLFKVMYKELLHLLHIEFESGADDNMRERLLAYNSIFPWEHLVPVISLIIYPFRTTIAQSPLGVESPVFAEIGANEMMTFHFLTLPLFTIEAEVTLRKHLACMYPVLPTMQGVNAEMIKQAMGELAELYRDDEVSLSQQFVWMELLLERTTMLSPEEKQKVQGSIKMYDPLWEEHPKVKKIKAAARAEVEEAKAELEKGKAQAKAEAKAEIKRAKAQLKVEAEARAEAKAKAEIEAARMKAEAEVAQAKAEAEKAVTMTLRNNLTKFVQVRFPELTEVAQQTTARIASPDALNLLLTQVASAANATAARMVLDLSTN